MASGPEHYLAAERLLTAAEGGDMDETMLDQDEYLFAAQVHATLALAAATAQPMDPAWVEALR